MSGFKEKTGDAAGSQHSLQTHRARESRSSDGQHAHSLLEREGARPIEPYHMPILPGASAVRAAPMRYDALQR